MVPGVFRPKPKGAFQPEGRYSPKKGKDRASFGTGSSAPHEEASDCRPTLENADNMRRGLNLNSEELGFDAPREMQPANWGSPTSGLSSPRESVPVTLRIRQRSGRCSLGLPPPQGFLPRLREGHLRALNPLGLHRAPGPKTVSRTAPRGLT